MNYVYEAGAKSHHRVETDLLAEAKTRKRVSTNQKSVSQQALRGSLKLNTLGSNTYWQDSKFYSDYLLMLWRSITGRYDYHKTSFLSMPTKCGILGFLKYCKFLQQINVNFSSSNGCQDSNSKLLYHESAPITR